MMNLDLLELARHLKQERLYVSSEKHLLQKLHEEVTQLADKLYRVSWIARHQRQTLNSLILANVDSPPAACCHRANALEEVGFVDGYKKLGFQDTVYGEFLCCLKDNPKIVGMCLAQGEREYPTGIQCLVHNLMSSVYGNAVIQEDERRVLQLLQSLMEFELASSDDPRRLLRRGSCAFSHAMRLFTEGLFSGKLYLTAALHEPVMALLMENDTYFETDTRKMLDHLSNEEHLKLFGPKNSPTYTTKLQEYIDRVGHQLVALCNKFISSLKNSMFCFPQSLDWLISQFYKILIRSGKVDQTEVRAMCGDLLLTCFICPAIVNPEPYGVASDILISEVARFNLVQVAQILQSLSLMREDTQVKSGDILSQFAKGCMSSYLDTVIDSHSTNANPAINNNQLQGMTRSVALICESELHNLVAYFRSSLTANQGNPELKDLEVALSVLPNPANLSAPSISTSSGNTPGTTPPGTPGSISRKVAKKRLQEDQESESSSPPSDTCMVTQPEDVLVISLGNHPNECPGMLSESKVLSSLPTKSKSQSEDKRANLGSINEHPEKQLRFSAEASVTNDHLMEAMSIGASNSVYSIDYDNENTSNISGRNTPRSAISLASSTTDNPRPDLIDSTQLPNNANITDRFGKFEIGDELENKKMHGLSGETFSDTWSTDVIESDNSEPSEANPTERLQEISESDLEYSALGAVARLPESIMEISETTSETWSVDVLQSDSEALDDRLIEVADAPEVTGLQLLEEESEQMSSKASEGQSSRRSSYGSQSIGRSSNNDSPSGEDNPKKDQAQEQTDSNLEEHVGQTDQSHEPHVVKGAAQTHVNQQQEFNSLDDFGMASFSMHLTDQESRSFELQNALSSHDKRPSTVVVDHFYQLQGDNKLSLPSNQLETSSSESKLDSLLVDFDPLASNIPAYNQQSSVSVKQSNTLPLGARPKQKFIITSQFYDERGQRGPIGVTNPLYELSNGDFHSNGAIKSNSSNPFKRYTHPGTQKVVDPMHDDSDIFFLTETPPKRRTNPFDKVTPPNPFDNLEEDKQPACLDNDFTPTQENCQGCFEDAFTKAELQDCVEVETKKTQDDPHQDHSLEERDVFPTGGEELPSTNSYSSTRVDSGFASGESVDMTHLRGNSFTSSGSLSSNSGMLLSESGRFTSSGSYNKPSAGMSSFARSISFEGTTANNGEKASSQQIKAKTMKTRNLKENGSDKGKPWWKHLIGSRKPKNRTTKEEAKDLGEKRKKSSSTEGIQITGISNHGLQDVYSQDDGNIGMMSSSVPDTTSEDILDKYRGLGKTQSHDHLADVDEADNLLSFGMVQDRQQSMSDQDGQSIDSDLESSYSFQDAKRKLRIVLCAADFHTLPWLTNFSHRHRARSIIGSIIQKDISSYPENELIAFLKVQLAEAINLQNKSLIAQLHETLRCVASFDDDTSKRLVASLTEDYENRSPYICYLVLSRKGLIASKSHLERLLERVERDKYVSNKYFTSVCVRLFLGRQEEAIHKFISDFKRLTVSDEKTDLVEHFLSCLKNWIQQDAIWQSASEIQKLDAEVATERAIMGRIYQLALYPNAEGDIHRDQVLFEHIQRLSKVVTASHRSLQIPEKYRRESPWPAAQAEILNINVYKTPKDKLQCVLRCCSIIMNLLNMASDNSVPGADDFVPVMVFVLIKANPPSLLSTVQYVNSFYDNRLSGEEMYWWMQFSAAIEFIKTIDDRK
ncbi:GTPase-activating protein and VPS9 domain-containing protein 1-like isoform X2 [Anneissia japonica]|uniref:GTPase-activating protein and VPS9 domain-containing protein 1-like isoform X2 n=1 Tax=Anneissia japonica TaxID=1529436 RepID=UPI0014255BC2|nr:GTPase-activating protein and VPS9 domain-containing protein 1-like isoform X2 [Anneissia japonica]